MYLLPVSCPLTPGFPFTRRLAWVARKFFLIALESPAKAASLASNISASSGISYGLQPGWVTVDTEDARSASKLREAKTECQPSSATPQTVIIRGLGIPYSRGTTVKDEF